MSKDADFHERSVIHGFPPKVVWIKRGNCSTQQIAQLLRSNSARIVELDEDSAGAFLLIR